VICSSWLICVEINFLRGHPFEDQFYNGIFLFFCIELAFFIIYQIKAKGAVSLCRELFLQNI
jgi:hypothetical protein